MKISNSVPHIVQYQGSKRLLAPQILEYMPNHFDRLIEPFSGMAAISIATAFYNKTEKFIINDLNKPVVSILEEAVNNPSKLIEDYTKIWEKQFTYGENHPLHFFDIRDEFNLGNESPENMLYLLARCVKGAVRYGKNGKFNQSPDKRRHGTTPKKLASNVYAVSDLLRGKSQFFAMDYHDILDMARPGDIVYMDPPYQGVSNVRDNRYLSGVSFEDFVNAVRLLDNKNIDYIISYDGECGGKEYGNNLPDDLHCKKMLLNAGQSSQATLLGKKAITFEALYVSQNLL